MTTSFYDLFKDKMIMRGVKLANNVRIERIGGGVNEWKVKGGKNPDESIAKLVIHQNNNQTPYGYGIQLKFSKRLSPNPNFDEIKNKDLTFHRVVAGKIGPKSCRSIAEALIEAAEEMERRIKEHG